jgi:hypothetical protein
MSSSKKKPMMNQIKRLLSCVLGIFLISAAAAEEQVTVSRTAERATIENSRIRVEFDLVRGTYRATDQRDGSAGFRDGCVQIGEWTSTQAGTTCRATDHVVTDGLGTGRTLAVECVREGQPTLLLEISLYPKASYCTLRAGILNATGKSFRLKEFYALTAARALPGVAEIRQARTLNAEGGGRNTFVQSGSARSSP